VADDIVTRLRDRQRELEYGWPDDDPPLTWVGEAANEIERLRAMVDWFVDGRLWDFDDHPEYGPGLAYDGIIRGEPLPDDIVQAFRQAVLLEEERIRQERREESCRG
jgi:hypothetical protein